MYHLIIDPKFGFVFVQIDDLYRFVPVAVFVVKRSNYPLGDNEPPQAVGLKIDLEGPVRVGATCIGMLDVVITGCAFCNEYIER